MVNEKMMGRRAFFLGVTLDKARCPRSFPAPSFFLLFVFFSTAAGLLGYRQIRMLAESPFSYDATIKAHPLFEIFSFSLDPTSIK